MKHHLSRLLCAAIALSALTGCVASGQRFINTMGEGTEITIARTDTIIASAIIAPIYVDGRRVASLGMCEWVAVPVNPGRHVVRSDRGTSITLMPEPGSPAFVILDPDFGGMAAAFSLREVMQSEARWHMTGCKRL